MRNCRRDAKRVPFQHLHSLASNTCSHRTPVFEAIQRNSAHPTLPPIAITNSATPENYTYTRKYPTKLIHYITYRSIHANTLMRFLGTAMCFPRQLVVPSPRHVHGSSSSRLLVTSTAAPISVHSQWKLLFDLRDLNINRSMRRACRNKFLFMLCIAKIIMPLAFHATTPPPPGIFIES